MKTIKLLTCILIWMVSGEICLAENLLSVYQSTLKSNPDIKQAQAQKTASLAKVAETKSTLLPQVGLSAGVNRYKYQYKNSYNLREDASSASLSVSQTLFDMSKWSALSLQEKNQRLQDIALNIAQQKLIMTVASDYFNVLNALDNLNALKAQKEAISKRLEQVKESFQVGLSAMTDVLSVQAQYDSLLATEMTYKNNLDNAREQLWQVSGQRYSRLASLEPARFQPRPAGNLAQMIKVGEQHNLSLLQARMNETLSREQIRYAETGHLPTLNVTASEGLTNTHYNTHYSDTDSAKESIALTFSMPLYSGGAVSAKVEQAQASFVAAGEQQENAHRNMEATIRSAFNSMNAATSAIKAYQQAEISAKAALDATAEGYSVGTRTIVDVLDATSALFNTRQQLATARYTWVINLLNIKSAQGVLNEQDVIELNAKLGAEVGI